MNGSGPLPSPPGLTDEARRLETLTSYDVLDTLPETSFDDLTLLASQICETPISLLSFVDEKRQWFKSAVGLKTRETPRSVAFCAHAIAAPDRVFEVRDAVADERFRANPLVVGEPGIRFYAGAPLVAPNGEALGALCVIDRRPRELSNAQTASLTALARQAVVQLELHRQARELGAEVARRRSFEEELKRRARGLHTISLCNQAFVRARDELHLFREICQICVRDGGFALVWIGRARHDAARTRIPLAVAGDDDGFFGSIQPTWGARDGSLGPAARAMESGEVVVVEDLSEEPALRAIFPVMRSKGLRAALYFPLKVRDETVAVLCLYTKESLPVRRDEVRILHDVAQNLSVAVTGLRLADERDRAEAAVLASLREKEALLKEVHHRVKNNLQVMGSLIRLEARRVADRAARNVLDGLQSRIHSMSLLHETLYRSEDFDEVDLGVYLRQVATQMFQSMADRSAIRLDLRIESMRVDVDRVIPCGLIVNELASNAFKHAFAGGAHGTLRIGLRPTPDWRGGELHVSDTGPGLPPDFDERRRGSLGMSLVDDLVRQLGGDLRIDAGPPAAFHVSFPLELRPGAATRAPVNMKDPPS